MGLLLSRNVRMFSFHRGLEVEKNKSMFSESRDVGSEK